MLGTCNTRATARQTVNVHVCTNKKKVNKSAPQMRYGQGVLRQAGECWGFVFKKMLSSACIDVNVARSSVKFEEFRNDRNQPRMIYDDRGTFIWSRIPGSELCVSIRTLILNICKLFCKIVLSIVRNVYCLFGGYVFFITRTLSRES